MKTKFTKKHILTTLLILLHINCFSVADTYYVSANGNDRNSGLSIKRPFKTVIKAINQAKAGDVVYLRGGIYRQSISLGADSLAQFNTNATASSRIIFKSYPSEHAVITSMQLRDKPQYWEKVAGHENVYMTDISPSKLSGKYKPERVPNCSQYGIPLKLMTTTYDNGGPELLTGPGQWVRNTNLAILKIYVWSPDSKNPGLHKTEICEFPRGGTCTIGLYRNHSRTSKKTQSDYITFEDLTIEGGYYTLLIETNNIEVKNCNIRNCYGDAIKVSGAKPADPNNPGIISDINYFNSKNGVVQNCDIYNFGEQGIDVTGGDYWVIKNNLIHNNASNRGDLASGTKSNGIILKNNCINAIVEHNKIYEIDSSYGAVTIGGSSWSNIADEAVGCVVRENEIYNIAGPYVLLFMAAKNCSFRDNLVRDCRLSNAIIRFASGNTGNPKFLNRDCSVVNNTFFNNQVSSGFFYNIPTGTVVNLKSDYNTFQPLMDYLYNDEVLTMEQFRKLGYEINSKTKIPEISN